MYHYQIGTHTGEQYTAMRESICSDDNEYTEFVRDCTMEKDHSPTRGVFYLTEAEAEIIKAKPEVRFIQLDPHFHPEPYEVSEDDLHCMIEETYRYNEPVKNYNEYARGTGTNYLPVTSPTVADLRRCGYQLARTTRKNGPKPRQDIWNNDIVMNLYNLEQTGTGKDVDICVMDNGTWIGHIEFINNRPAGESPTGYIGGNPLPGDGICDCLDMVLDGPYYLDPDWFNAAPGSRLETRWDGTTVPTESEARAWWGSVSNRSNGYGSYGTITVSTNYTRLRANGDFNTAPFSGTHGTQCGSQVYGRTHGWAYNANKWVIDGFSSYGLGIDKTFELQKVFHQAKPVNPKYGNKNPTISSNSWGYRATPPSSGYATHRGSQTQYTTDGTKPQFMRYVGDAGDGGRMKCEFVDSALTVAGEELIDAGVIFVVAAGNSTQKQTKSNHPDYNNFFHTSSSGTITDGSTFSQFGYAVYPTTNRPGMPQHIGKRADPGLTYNIGVANNSASSYYFTSGSDRQFDSKGSGPNLSVQLNAGDTVNFNVNVSGHPFYIKTTSTTGTGNQAPGVTNNGAQVGTVSFTPTTAGTYYYICQYHGSMVGQIVVSANEIMCPAINIGALDDSSMRTNAGGAFSERKVDYSDMGESIDCFAPADGSLAATTKFYGLDVPRWDGTYVSKSGNTTWSDGQTGSPLESRDTRFSGTSSACPIAAGLIGTIMQYNRNWTYLDVKAWLKTLYVHPTVDGYSVQGFHDAAEETTANGNGHADLYALQGAEARIIYQGGTFSETTKEITTKDVTFGNGIGVTGSLGFSRD